MLKARLDGDIKAAMKDREAGKLRLSVLRMVKSAAKYLEIERKEGLTDEDLLTVFVKEVKQRRDSIDEFKKGNRMDLVEASEAELRELVQAAVQETGAQSKKDMGKVMAALMPRTKGRADGKLLNRIVQEFLP